MRVLFVTPSELASGEGITALHMAENAVAQSSEVHFLASAFTASFLKCAFPGRITEFTQDRVRNRELWESCVRQFRPDLIVFADYPLLFFTSGSSRLADEDWAASLEAFEPALVTLDHLGYAQKMMTVFFGPPHLSFRCQTMPPLPRRMHILLPCPMHEPSEVPGRKGTPFRYWKLPYGLPWEQAQDVRGAYSVNHSDLLILHSVPNWAWRYAESYGLPYFSFLPRLWEYYLGELPRSVTVVSVNNGSLLPTPAHPRIRVVNLGPVSKDTYEQLLGACDLMITENGVSAGLGKAVCSLLPCAVFCNSRVLEKVLRDRENPARQFALEMERLRLGSVFPHEVFPIWRQEDLDQLGLFRCNSITRALAHLEIFGGSKTRDFLRRLLMDESTREELRTRQKAYVQKLASLPDSSRVLYEILGATVQG